MAKIDRVDYEKMPKQASDMRRDAKDLNTELTKAYASIAEMHDSWYGKRYNELVKAFNEMIPSINDMLNLVVKEIPCTLETVANNYAIADIGRNVTAVNGEGPIKITDLTITNDVGMKFITSNVSSIKENVAKNFKNAKMYMDSIEQAYAKVVWDSEAAEVFKSEFTKFKNNIVTSFESIESQFTKLMEQTQQDIQNAENANTVK